MAKRAVLYARVSGDDRHREDRNLLSQLDICQEYAQQRGYEIVAELAEDDRGVSGAVFDLPQLSRVREMAQAGAFDVLVTRELDRLSRSLAKQLFVEDDLQRHGVEIEYVLGEYPDTPEGSLHKNVLASVAEFERLKINERLVRARQLKVKNGSVLVHGSAPYGYTAVKHDKKSVLEVCDPEADIVRQIFEWYTVGDGSGRPLSTYAIQKKLNAMQVPTYADVRQTGYIKKRPYGEWARAAIRDILNTETYAGTWHYRKFIREGNARIPRSREDLIPVAVPAIISRETWGMAQARRAERAHMGRHEVKYDLLLRGRAVCGQCGAKLRTVPKQAEGGRRRIYYRCPAAFGHVYNNYALRCDAPPFRAEVVDSLVWQWAKSLLIDPSVLEQGRAALQEERDQETAPLRERLREIDNLLAEDRREMEQLLDLYLAANLSKEQLGERQEALSNTVSALERERDGLVRRLETPAPTDQQVADLQQFAAQVSEGLAHSAGDFAFRRFVIETLDVQAALTVEEGQRVAVVRCVLGEVKVPIGRYSRVKESSHDK